MLRAMPGSIPAWLSILFTLISGLVFGSFSSALIYRVPSRESLLTRSKCTKCSKQLGATENIPLISYLVLRGKCSGCGSRISWIYPTLEVGLAALFLFPVLYFSSWTAILFWVAISIFGVPLLVIDLKHHRLPDLLTISLFLLVLVILLVSVIATSTYNRLIPSCLGALGVMAFYLALLIISRGGMGMGDVKLSASIGLVSGYFGLKVVFLSSFSAFSLGAIFGIFAMIFGKAGRKTAIPFGPFIIVGQLISMLVYSR